MVLCPTPVDELKCTEEELDAHLEKTYGDPYRGTPLGHLKGLPERTSSPTTPFMMTNIARKEYDALIRKRSSKGHLGTME